jgi:hypothetical protein
MSAAPPQVLAGINVVRPPGRVAYAGLAAAPPDNFQRAESW